MYKWDNLYVYHSLSFPNKFNLVNSWDLPSLTKPFKNTCLAHVLTGGTFDVQVYNLDKGVLITDQLYF